MNSFSDDSFRPQTAGNIMSRPQDGSISASGGSVFASLWPDIATFVVYGLVSPFLRGARTPEVRDVVAQMDDRSLALLNVDRADRA